MKFKEKHSKELWDQFLKSTNNTQEREKILTSMLRSGAGWYLFKEISDYIYQGNLDDNTTLMLVDILSDAYEGGTLKDNTTANALNIKDQIIQDLLREQLNNPIGKESLLFSMNLLYMVENGNQTNILEETLEKNGHLLTESEKLKYRLKYGFFDLDRLEQVISELPDRKNNSEYFKTVSRHFNEFVLLNKNKLNANISLKNELRGFLEDNPVSFENYESLSIDDQYSLSENYTEWLRMYGATEGAEDLDDYLFETSANESDPRKVLSVVDYYLERSEYTEDNSEYDRLINNPDINTTLNKALSGDELPESEKKRLKILLGFPQKQELSTTITTISEFEEKVSLATSKEKETIQAELIRLTKSNSLSEEKKGRIKEFLENNF